MLQLCLLTTTFGLVFSSPGPQTSYGLPPAADFSTRFLQDSPVQTFSHHQSAGFRSFARRPPSVAPQPVFQSASTGADLELLPPLQHVVGTLYPAVDPGPGFRFPLSQILNPTPPPGLLH